MLNERSNIVVFCDEAHRTQEGQLGQGHARRAPERDLHRPDRHADLDRRPRHLRELRRPGRPGHVLNDYDVERSIADGATLPIIVETRLVDFHIDQEALDEAFEEMAAEEGLDEDEKEVLARKAVAARDAAEGAGADHAASARTSSSTTRRRIAPLGLKAQVVAYDRELCVLYQEEIERLLAERGEGGSRRS